MKTQRHCFLKGVLWRLRLFFLFAAAPAMAVVDDAHSQAMEAALPYVKEGFVVRNDFWAGDLKRNQSKSIPHQLYKGNVYWFWMGVDGPDTKVSIHIYDSSGNLAEKTAWSRPILQGGLAAACIEPLKSGTYYLVVTMEESPKEVTRWALAYGFR